jgi:hypothetical protein
MFTEDNIFLSMLRGYIKLEDASPACSDDEQITGNGLYATNGGLIQTKSLLFTEGALNYFEVTESAFSAVNLACPITSIKFDYFTTTNSIGTVQEMPGCPANGGLTSACRKVKYRVDVVTEYTVTYKITVTGGGVHEREMRIKVQCGNNVGINFSPADLVANTFVKPALNSDDSYSIQLANLPTSKSSQCPIIGFKFTDLPSGDAL